MSRRLLSAAALLIGNAAGLLLAALLLEGFTIAPLSFIVVVAIFTLVQVIADPLLTRVGERHVPALKGGIALVVTFVGLLLTDFITTGLVIGGISNLLVWLGALIAAVLIPIFVFKDLREKRQK